MSEQPTVHVEFIGGSRDGLVQTVTWEGTNRALCEREIDGEWFWGCWCSPNPKAPNGQYEIYIEEHPHGIETVFPPKHLRLIIADWITDEEAGLFRVFEE